jgi:ABC-type sulfate transport system substrate-binding protein
MVFPRATIFSEHPAVVIDRNVSQANRPIVNAFLQYLWSEEAQRGFVQNNFRSITSEILDRENPGLGEVEMPFTIEYFGGWGKAYPDIIESTFRDRVMRR